MNSIIRKLVALAIMWGVANECLFAQGKVAGKIVDKSTGETVIGANITIEGANTGGVSDLDGNYFIVCPEGKYTMKVEYLGYTPTKQEVTVKNKETTYLNVVITEAAEQLNEVVVQANTPVRETVNALLIQQKNAVSMVTGISAEQFRKLPDKSTSDVLKRISGASIQENKFAIIRGLNDRYNMALLNGVPMPSTESDRKAFSFDIVPANLLDNLMISKTATPDMPGDFAGGLIQINTKDIPEENTYFLNVGSSTHSLTTFNEYFKSPTKNTTSFLGSEAASPSGVLPTNEALMLRNDKSANASVIMAEQAKLFDNNFDARKANSISPNYSLQGGLSRRFNLAGNPLGILFSTTYSKSFRFTPFTNNEPVISNNGEYDPNTVDGTFLNINNYKTSINSGTLLNLSYRIGQNHKLSLKNLYTVNSDDQSIFRNGMVYSEGRQSYSKYDDYIFWFQNNKMLSSQLIGESAFGKVEQKIKLRYNVGITDINRTTPDYKRLIYKETFLIGNEEKNPKLAEIQSRTAGFSPLQSGRFSSQLNERVYSGSYSVSIPFVFLIKNEIKIGGFHQLRDRSFDARNYLFAYDEKQFSPSIFSTIFKQGPDSIFADANFGVDKIMQIETTSPNDSYKATSANHAGFFMMDNKITSKLRLIWGLRFENFSQNISSRFIGVAKSKTREWNDFLPSLNAIYSVTEKSNVRFSYSRTLSRPEFREFAPLAFFDFNLNAAITGNPDLTRAKIHNLDLRYELFLGEGQLISATPFYKMFDSPVESAVQPNTGGRSFEFLNAKSATNLGIELEWRTSFGILDKLLNTSFLKNLNFYTNYAWIRSEVNLKGTDADVLGSRPLQGQSPYVFNGGLQYSNTDKGFDVTIAANRIGRRIAFVANEPQFLIYENSRTVLDFSVSKKFFKKLTARAVFGDILANSQPLIFYQDINNNGSFDKGKDVETFNYSFGWTSSFSLGYTF